MVGSAGVLLVQNRLSAADAPQVGSDWSDGPGRARHRIEGVAKVTGQKIYARDFRAADMLGWPGNECVAMVLRANESGRALRSINLAMLPTDLQPLAVVTGDRLKADGITAPHGFSSPEPWPSGLLVMPGQRPIYLGQPVAILIFDNHHVFRRAKAVLQFNADVIVYGEAVATPAASWAESHATHLTRYADNGKELFSRVGQGPSDPSARHPSAVDVEALRVRGLIGQVFERPDVRVVEGRYDTQVVDTMFMEPEAGLAWLDVPQQTLHLVMGTQSTNGDLAGIAQLFQTPGRISPVRQIELNACYPGGGFGGRDMSVFPLLLALAAAYASPTGQRAVRLAYDRFEQFQAGLKQLDSAATQRIALDSRGQLLAMESRLTLHTGGLENYSQHVARLAAYSGTGAYRVDCAAVDAHTLPTAGVLAGSMRGFGGTQAHFAIESLMDEAAQTLGRDPIELRAQNALRQGDRSITGAPLAQTISLVEICRLARTSALWQDRPTARAQAAADGQLYGLGFALANQAYGTGVDGVMAEVAIGPDGALTMRSNSVDMGNGSATTLALSTARYAGSNASTVVMGEASRFEAPLGFDLGLPARQAQWENPRWTAAFALSSSACITAHHQVHVVEQATRVLLHSALLPAAASLWEQSVESLHRTTRWQAGLLHLPGRPQSRPLSLTELARRLHLLQLPAAVMAHAVFQGRWVQARFRVDGWQDTLPLDGLATRLAGASHWRCHDRTHTEPPLPESGRYGRSLYAPSGALVAVRVDSATGSAQVVAVESFLESGRVLQPDLLEGQVQGAVAMGIGYALLEQLPPLAGGAGEGDWNLHRYRVARSADIPLKHLRMHLLSTTEPVSRGIAEAALCPIAPAVANAVADATGHRFRSLPITAEQIKTALGSRI
jgi:CO/xanthine dehydrogenase Mo-binding subunit